MGLDTFFKTTRPDRRRRWASRRSALSIRYSPTRPSRATSAAYVIEDFTFDPATGVDQETFNAVAGRVGSRAVDILADADRQPAVADVRRQCVAWRRAPAGSVRSRVQRQSAPRVTNDFPAMRALRLRLLVAKPGRLPRPRRTRPRPAPPVLSRPTARGTPRRRFRDASRSPRAAPARHRIAAPRARHSCGKRREAHRDVERIAARRLASRSAPRSRAPRRASRARDPPSPRPIATIAIFSRLTAMLLPSPSLRFIASDSA